MDIKKTFKSDLSKEKEGVWVDLDNEGTRVKIARAGNPAYSKAFKRLCEPHLAIIRKGRLDEKLADKLLVQALAEGVLVDWENFKDGDVSLPYSVEAAVKLLSDPELKDFRDLVVNLSDDSNRFKAAVEDDGVKN